MDRHLLNRRQFSARCAAFGLSFPALSATLATPRHYQEPVQRLAPQALHSRRETISRRPHNAH